MNPLTVGARMLTTLEAKVKDVLEGSTAKRGDLEIVLGSETEKTIIEDIGRLGVLSFGPDAAPDRTRGEIEPRKTLHRGRMLGIDIVVDAGTPRLTAVRVKLKRIGA